MEKTKKEKLKNSKGITLLALVITIVILIILALVAINYAFGDNGMVSYADKAKFETEKASAREEIELVLLEAGVEKTFNSEYDENEFLDNFVEARLEGIELSQDEVTYKEFAFALDRSVPRLGDYTGPATGPRIKEIRVTETTTNSISIEVDARNAEGGKYTYWYKKEDEEKWIEAEKNVETNTYTYEGLEENVIYNLKVKLETKEGSIEKETSMNTGEMPKGTIQFTDPEWIGDGTAKVTISTSAEVGEKYKLQYIIIGQEESTEGIKDMKWEETTSGSEITGLYHGDTVYGRLYDGVNQSDYASSSIEDKISPVVTLEGKGTTTNSVSVSASATDGQSGMKDIVTYTYSIKVTGQADSTYTTPGNANGITANTYTFTGLTQGTNYTVRVQVNGDKAGLIGTGTLENQITGTVGGATGGLATGNIVASTPTWSNGTASITLTTNTGMQIQYQVNSASGSWTTISSGGKVTGLNHNDTVYARLYDGNNYGDYSSVTIQDKIAPSAPTITLSGTVGNNSYYRSNVTVTITAGSDGQSGANKVRYSVNGAQTIVQTDTAVGTTSTNITISVDGTSTITAYTLDKAGNVSSVATKTLYKDNTAPNTASLTIGSVGETSIAVTASGTDATSGIYSYQFQRSATSSTSGFSTVATQASSATSYSYTYTGLTAGTTYYLRVIVTDKAGNAKTGTAVTQATKKIYPTASSTLKAGNYVYYIDGTGIRRTCVVLYDSSSSYGVEITTMESVEGIELGYNDSTVSGSDDITKVMNSYNNAINNLNSRASLYNNSVYSDRARSIGSKPNNPISDTTTYFTSGYKYMSEYDGKFKNEDNNYETDYNQMDILGIKSINRQYWLASRRVESNSFNTYFYIRFVYDDGSLGNNWVFNVYSGTGGPYPESVSYTLRPVFRLKPTVRVTGGNGTSSSPYTLGV